jgi:ABC-type multidrug transport system ATPase subunit
VLALEDISFSIDPESRFGLLGPNDAGRTTTMAVIQDVFI